MIDIFESFEKSIRSLEKILKQEKNETVRDAAIKRFELTFELSWKSAQAFLKDQGITCRSPKETFKEAFKFGLIKGDEEWIMMLKDRNLSIHTYSEELADDMYSRIGVYLNLFSLLRDSLQEYL